MNRLLTIPISHYCEKARWALERASIPYREERHVQGVHQIVSKRAGGAGTVPVLVTPDAVLGESEDIVAWVDERTPSERRLIPADPSEREDVMGFARRLDNELGPAGRRLMYVHMLGQRKLLLRFNNEGVPRREDLLMRYGWSLVSRFAKRELEITPGIEVADEAAVWREFDLVAERLSDGRKYLFGDTFGIADLTFAALAAASIVPPIYSVPLPQPEVLAPETAALVTEARAHPAGHYAMTLFETERRRTVVDSD